MNFRLIYPAEHPYLQTYSRCWTLGSLGHSKQLLIFRLIHPAELDDFRVNLLRCTPWSTGLSSPLNIKICGLLSTTEHHAVKGNYIALHILIYRSKYTLLDINICGLLSTTERHALMVTILRWTSLSVRKLHIATQHYFWVTSYSLLTILSRLSCGREQFHKIENTCWTAEHSN